MLIILIMTILIITLMMILIMITLIIINTYIHMKVYFSHCRMAQRRPWLQREPRGSQGAN